MKAVLKTHSLAETTTSKLRREIYSGRLPSGTSLAEAAVAKRLGVSRVPVREALATLERDGLVEFTPTGRTIVKDLSPQDFEELFALRLLLEPAAAKLAAPLAADLLRAMEENIAATRKAKSLEEVTYLDLDFHQLIMVASGNSRLMKLWQSLRSELGLWLGGLHRKHRDRKLDTRGKTAESHEAIVAALCTKSPSVCERLLREHILGWREWLPASAADGETGTPAMEATAGVRR